ncbi:MAG TPA: glycine betaine ABC transporter substrate-binding protein [Thermoleophilaceae bacterium]|nr:glycine betaine ABC transporter substrate-binding protein [Thermoleophilaceae bacterium]
MRRPTKMHLAVLAAAVLALALGACGGGGGGGGGGEQAGGGAPKNQPIQRNPQNASKSVKVGSKNFPEQLVLGEIYAQSLAAAGYKVEKELNLGSEVVAFKALKNGDVDAYPEYTGTVLTTLYKVEAQDAPKEPDQAFEQAKQRLGKDKITALPRSPFENTYRLGATKQTAQRLGVRTTSDLKGKAKQLKITGYPECRQRLDCYVGVQRTYGLRFEDFVASEQTYEVLDQGEADVGFLFTTDAQLSTGKYQTFEDDKNFFPPYNVTLLMRDEALQKLGPEAQQVVDRVQRPLTEPVMIELNSRVVLDKQQPEDVAQQYLKAEGFIQ